MMKYSRQSIVKLTLIFFVIISCSEAKSQKAYFNDLGEIPYDSQLDDENFVVCHEDITLPFNYGGVGLVYKGEKRELVNTFTKKYSYPKTEGQTGYVTVRFIINCMGKAGRFRVTQMDLNLQKIKFNDDITQQLLNITKNLDGWKPFFRNEKTWDYQQYLTFKIVDGKLKKILP